MNTSGAVLASRFSLDPSVGPRRIAHHVHGRQHGPIQRLVSPSDIGELIKPFVFLDYANVPPRDSMFGIHPHSGIATLTVVISGALAYEDTTGKSGSVGAGGLEWMKAGGGVWHDGHPIGSEPLRLYQLWVALPPSEENAPAESQYIAAEDVQQEGPARVVLGQLGEATSAIRSPPGINYLHVRLQDGQHWRYTPPAGHTVAWVSVYEGELRTMCLAAKRPGGEEVAAALGETLWAEEGLALLAAQPDLVVGHEVIAFDPCSGDGADDQSVRDVLLSLVPRD